MSADKLALVEQAQNEALRKSYGSKAGSQFTTEVKESLLFQYNWNELLAAAPTSIALIGACHIAAASQEAAAISLADSVPQGGFKYLRVAEKPTLKACLIFVADRGNRAFQVAGNNMSAISATSGELLETVKRTVQAIQGLPDTSRNLENELNKLRRMSDQCLKDAQDTENGFDSWLLAVSEFHQASVQKHGVTEQQVEANMSAKLQAEIESSYTQKELDRADSAAKKMEESLHKQEAAFKQANDAVPSAWETCAMGVLTAITTAGPTLLAQVLPTMINVSNPMTNVAKAGSAAAAQPILQFPDATPNTDPAYSAAPLLSPFINSLYAYLTAGPDNGPDWNKFKDQKAEANAATGAEASTQGLTWLLSNLQMQKSSAKLGNEKPSVELASTFDTTISVVSEIKKEIANKQSLSTGKTDSVVIKKWQDAILESKQTVAKLEATAKSFPGTSSNAPKMQNIPTNIPKADQSAQTAALSAATEKLALNQKALETAQANYSKAIDAAAEVQKKLTAVAVKLEGLKNAGATLEKVKEILVDCIAILVELKIQISKLTAFFRALSTMVKVVVNTKVKSFDDDASALGKDAERRGLLKLNNLDIETIYTSTLQIKAYFDLLQTICKMYTQVHVEHVHHGLELLTDLSATVKNPDELGPKRDALKEFTDGAQKAIMKIVGDKQREISDGLRDRIDTIAQQNQMLKKADIMPAPGVIDAIKTGGEAIQNAVQGNLPTGMRIEVNVGAADDI